MEVFTDAPPSAVSQALPDNISARSFSHSADVAVSFTASEQSLEQSVLLHSLVISVIIPEAHVVTDFMEVVPSFRQFWLPDSVRKNSINIGSPLQSAVLNIFIVTVRSSACVQTIRPRRRRRRTHAAEAMAKKTRMTRITTVARPSLGTPYIRAFIRVCLCLYIYISIYIYV
jgi:hypothetical protein